MANIESIRASQLYQSIRADGGTVAYAYNSVIRQWAFMRQLSADVKAQQKRSKAARQGWKNRRA